MEKKIGLLLMIPFLLFWHWFEPAAKKNQQGLKAYEARQYEQALQNFLSAKGIKPTLPQLKNNTASTLYQLKKYQAALEEFSKIDPERSGISKSDFLYNLGNAFFRLNQYDKALESYKGSLILNPEDINAKKNYELAQKKLKEQKNQQKKDQDKESDKENKDQQEEQKKNRKQNQHKNLMQYLNQNEKKQMKKKQRKLTVVKKEKDW